MGKKVKIIMNQDVLNLGEEGDIRDVASGYARNYLFPKKLAAPYNAHTLTILGQKRRKIEKRKAEKKALAQGMREQMEQEIILFQMPAGENGKLFGSINNGHIADELGKKGYAVEKKKIEVPDHHIKMVGEYSVKVKLYGDEEATLKVTVKAQEIPAVEKSEKTARGSRSRGGRQEIMAEEAPADEEQDEEEEYESDESLEDDEEDEEDGD